MMENQLSCIFVKPMYQKLQMRKWKFGGEKCEKLCILDSMHN